MLHVTGSGRHLPLGELLGSMPHLQALILMTCAIPEMAFTELLVTHPDDSYTSQWPQLRALYLIGLFGRHIPHPEHLRSIALLPSIQAFGVLPFNPGPSPSEWKELESFLSKTLPEVGYCSSWKEDPTYDWSLMRL